MLDRRVTSGFAHSAVSCFQLVSGVTEIRSLRDRTYGGFYFQLVSGVTEIRSLRDRSYGGLLFSACIWGYRDSIPSGSLIRRTFVFSLYPELQRFDPFGIAHTADFIFSLYPGLLKFDPFGIAHTADFYF